jgi:hypothetical protein
LVFVGFIIPESPGSMPAKPAGWKPALRDLPTPNKARQRLKAEKPQGIAPSPLSSGCPGAWQQHFGYPVQAVETG